MPSLDETNLDNTQLHSGAVQPNLEEAQPQPTVDRPRHEEAQPQVADVGPDFDESQSSSDESQSSSDEPQSSSDESESSSYELQSSSDESQYSSDDSQSSSDESDFESALPAARWGPPLPRFKLSTVQHGALAGYIQKQVKKSFIKYFYDSANNFIGFYDDYLKSGGPLLDFFKYYEAPIRPKQYTCVGLGLQLIKRLKPLDSKFPGLSQSTSLLSCEESVNNNVNDYVRLAPGPHEILGIAGEKEHVLVGIQIEINGRNGVMIADPGYHVSKVVTVMNDGEYPHTGAFMQIRQIQLVREYVYFTNKHNSNYIEWHERQLKHKKFRNLTSLIFASRPFLSAIDISEKRNLVYSFKSQMNRDKKGNVVAGYYFPIISDFEKAYFYVFIGVDTRAKYYFKYFSNPRNIPAGLVEKIDMLSKFMNCSTRYLLNTFCKLAKVLANKKFIDQLLTIDSDIKQKTKIRFPNEEVVPPESADDGFFLLRDAGMFDNYAARLRYEVDIIEGDQADNAIVVDFFPD